MDYNNIMSFRRGGTAYLASCWWGHWNTEPPANSCLEEGETTHTCKVALIGQMTWSIFSEKDPSISEKELTGPWGLRGIPCSIYIMGKYQRKHNAPLSGLYEGALHASSHHNRRKDDRCLYILSKPPATRQTVISKCIWAQTESPALSLEVATHGPLKSWCTRLSIWTKWPCCQSFPISGRVTVIWPPCEQRQRLHCPPV